MKISQKLTLDREKAKYYLDYIDKEMTFAGIITTFCVGCLLFMVDKLFPKEIAASDLHAHVTDFHNIYFIVPMIYLAFSTFLLIWHRSKMAFYYGQIALEIYTENFSIDIMDRLLQRIDRWPFWFKYFLSFSLIICAFLLLCVFVFSTQFNNLKSIFWQNLLSISRNYEIWVIVCITALVLIIEFLHALYLNKKFPNNSYKRITL